MHEYVSQHIEVILDPIAALMLMYLAMALLIDVLKPSICSPETTRLCTHPVEPTMIIIILQVKAVSTDMSSDKG